MKPKNIIWVFTIGTFAVGTDAFIIAGMLDKIASDLQVHPAMAGQLITIFSISYALLAPISSCLTEGINRKTIVLVALFLFILGNIVSALCNSFFIMALGRVIAASGASSFTPQAYSIAALVVSDKKKGYALSVVMGGMTLSIALGIPLGTFIGQCFSWRATLLGIATLSAIPLLSAWWLLPSLVVSAKHSLKDRLSLVTYKPVILIFLVTFLAVLSEHIVYSYISLILGDVTYEGEHILLLALVCFGTGALLGNVLAGYGTDKLGSKKILFFSLAAQSLSLLSLVWVYNQPFFVCLALFTWGVTGWMYLVPIQHRLLEISKRFGTFALSLNSSVLYFGMAMGSLLGGGVVSIGPSHWLGVPAFFIGCFALWATTFAYKSDNS